MTQLSPESKRAVLETLAADAASRREARVAYAENQIRRLCAERGLDWDQMSEPEREAFIDDLIHEDRAEFRGMFRIGRAADFESARGAAWAEMARHVIASGEPADA